MQLMLMATCHPSPVKSLLAFLTGLPVLPCGNAHHTVRCRTLCTQGPWHTLPVTPLQFNGR